MQLQDCVQHCDIISDDFCLQGSLCGLIYPPPPLHVHAILCYIAEGSKMASSLVNHVSHLTQCLQI